MTEPQHPTEPLAEATPPVAAAGEVGPVAPFDQGDFADAVFAYLLSEFPQIAGPKYVGAKDALRDHFAGERVYVAKRTQEKREHLAREVLTLFNGRNATEVARRLRISRTQVYRILKQSCY